MAGDTRKPDGVPRKRKWGQGSIRWKHGAWEITVRPYRGAPQDPWTRLPGATVDEAQARLDLMVAQVKSGGYRSPAPAPTAMTVEDLWERYHAHLTARVAAGTLQQARVDDLCSMMHAHILRAIGADRVDSVTSALLIDYIAAKKNGTAPVSAGAKPKLTARTIHHHIGLIGQMFRWAVHRERRYADYDPTSGLDLPAIDEEETRPYELDHVEAILRQLQRGTIRRVGVFNFATGCRLGESLGAQETAWRDAKSEIEFRHALKRSGGKTILGPRGKNRAARRDFAAGQTLAALVSEQLASNASLPTQTGHLFPTDVGTAWNPSNFRNRHWIPAVYAGYAKVMAPAARRRWLAAVPRELRDAARLLELDDVTIPAVLDAGWADVDGRDFRYVDADGRRRSAAMPAELADSLAAARAPASGPRIFPGERGQRIALHRFVCVVFRDPFEQLGIRFDRRVHRARHTYVSLLAFVDPELNPTELQHRIGHSNAASTERYRHVFEQHRSRPADVLAFLTSHSLPDAAERKLTQAAELLGMSPEMLRAQLGDMAATSEPDARIRERQLTSPSGG